MKRCVVLIIARNSDVVAGLGSLPPRHEWEIAISDARTKVPASERIPEVVLVVVTGDWVNEAGIRDQWRTQPVVFIPARDRASATVEAVERWLHCLCNILDDSNAQLLEFDPTCELTPKAPSNHPLVGGEMLVGASDSINRLREDIHCIAASDANVVITGETGTGKDVVAQLIHKNSRRRSMPFICINCAAIPDTLLESELFGYERGAFTGAVGRCPGKLELANRGSIFFDEIGEMSSSAQAKILRVIENRELYRLGGNSSVHVDLRIIAATNRDLDEQCRDQSFRRDLYYRLNVARLHLPPLRERKTDIPLLVDHYIRQFNGLFGKEILNITPNSRLDMLRYEWPGNIRELKNFLESAFVNHTHSQVRMLNLEPLFHRVLRGVAAGEPTEKDRLIHALWASDWNKTKAARRLSWSRMTLYRKLRQYGIAEGNRTDPTMAVRSLAECDEAAYAATQA
jgi:transcriptional regulator with GAF, ATPase, and Fis domain